MLPKNRNIFKPLTLIVLQNPSERNYAQISTSQQIFERENCLFKIACNKQRNVCVSLLRKTKRDYFANLYTKIMQDNRRFWKTVNSLSSKKFYSKESISLFNKDGLLTKYEDLAKTFEFF